MKPWEFQNEIRQLIHRARLAEEVHDYQELGASLIKAGKRIKQWSRTMKEILSRVVDEFFRGYPFRCMITPPSA